MKICDGPGVCRQQRRVGRVSDWVVRKGFQEEAHWGWGLSQNSWVKKGGVGVGAQVRLGHHVPGVGRVRAATGGPLS